MRVLVADDDLFYHGAIDKFFSVMPRVEIQIRFLVKHESEYLFKKLKHRKSIKEMIQNDQCILEQIHYDK